MFVIFSVFYILIAVAMIVLILMQRGAGADAGSGFGGGASATVFGARGSANFMSRATAVLAVLFFLLSLGMGFYLKMHGVRQQPQHSGLGVMAGLGKKAKSQVKPPSAEHKAKVVATGVPKPRAVNSDIPVAPAVHKAKAKSKVPVAPGKH